MTSLNSTSELNTSDPTMGGESASTGNAGNEDNFNQDYDSLKQSFGQLRNDVMNLLNNAIGTGKSGAHSLKGQAHDQVDHLRASGEDALENLKDQIAENPVLSVAIAFGVGYVVSKLF